MREIVFAPEAQDDLTQLYLFPGLRVVGFERRVTIAFHADTKTVTFLRILYGGRDIDALIG